jgi:hypothetical protein
MRDGNSHLAAPTVLRAGFTRTELCVTLATLALLAALVVVPLTSARAKSQLATCITNLRQVDRALLQYGSDHEGKLPESTAAQSGDLWWWYKEKVKSYLGLSGPSSPNDVQFACPLDRGYSDPKPFCKTPRFDYSSYVFNGVEMWGVPNIAGWKTANIQQPQKTLLVMEWTAHAPLSWHRSRTGRANAPFYKDAESVVAFVDGHAALTRIYYDGYNPAYMREPILGYDYQYSGK